MLHTHEALSIHGRHSNFSSWALERNHQKLKRIKTNGRSIIDRYVSVFEERFMFHTNLSDLYLRDEASGRLLPSDQLNPNSANLALPPFDAQMIKLAGEAIIQTATSIADSNLILLPQNRGTNQRLLEYFKYTLHPFAWGMANPEVQSAEDEKFIHPSNLDTEWPVQLGKRMRGVFGTGTFRWQLLLQYLREPDTYGKSDTNDWMTKLDEYVKADSKVIRLRILTTKVTVSKNRKALAKALAANTQVRKDLEKAITDKAKLFEALQNRMQNEVHLFITTPDLYKQVCVNGWTLDARVPGNSKGKSCVICVPYGEAGIGNQYAEWIGFVQYFAVFNVQSSSNSVDLNHDPNCSCPLRCLSTSNLDPNSLRRWHLAFVEW